MNQEQVDQISMAAKYHRTGIEQLEAGQMEEAVKALRCAAELNPHAWQFWNDLGVAMEVLGNPHDAIRCYRRALVEEPSQIEARGNLGALLVEVGMAQALRHYAFTSSMAF